MHCVAVVALHDVVAADLATPCEIFSRVRLADGGRGYEVRVCGEARTVRGALFDIRTLHGLDALFDAETVILPGVADPMAPVAPRVIAAVREAAARGARVASVCSGAFALAATGLLDGRRATTHWLAGAALASRHPAITVEPGVLYIDEGAVITSAGATAATDMCLHLVRRDHGHAVAAATARLIVAPLDRDGGQAQFIRHEAPGSADSLAPLLAWMEQNAAAPLGLNDLAARAGTSTRTLSRRFKAQTGATPLQWLLRARTRRAQELLETTGLSIETVATAVGFEAPSVFRDRFRRETGVSPSRYRETFRSA